MYIPTDTCCHAGSVLSPYNPMNLFDIFFFFPHRANTRSVSHPNMPKSAPVWIFCRTCQPLYHSLFRCGNLIFGVPLRRGNGHKGGEVKVQSPRLGGLWWSAWELEKGKLWLEYEWNHRRGGEERGKQRGEEKGGLWLNYSPHRGQQRRTFSISAQAWVPTGAATCRHTACSHLGWHVWQEWEWQDTVYVVHPFSLSFRVKMWGEKNWWQVLLQCHQGRELPKQQTV